MGCGVSRPTEPLEGAGLRLKDMQLLPTKFISLVKGRRLSSSDVNIVWHKYKHDRPALEAATLDDDHDFWTPADLTELLKHIRMWNYSDNSVPRVFLQWWLRMLNSDGRDRISKTQFKHFLWGPLYDQETPDPNTVMHPGPYVDGQWTCCNAEDHDEPGCTDQNSGGRVHGDIQAGARVTVGFEWPYFDEEDDPTTQELAAHGLFGTVLSAKRGMVTVQWDIPGSSACTYKWGADGKYDLCVIAEGPEDLDWRPLLTGGIPFLQKLANRTLSEEHVTTLWNMYDYNVNNTWSLLELRSLLEDLREIQFGDRDVPAEVARKSVERIKRESVVFLFHQHDTTGMDRITWRQLEDLLIDLGAISIPRLGAEEVENILNTRAPRTKFTTTGMLKLRDFVDWWFSEVCTTGEQLTWHEFRQAYVGKQLFTGGIALLRRHRHQVLTESMVRELWRVYDADGSDEIDYGEFAMFMEDMHELLMGNRLISNVQIRGTLALLDEDENGSIDWEEFRDYFKGYMLPDQDSFAEMRRDPAAEVEAKVDEALERVPMPERYGKEIERINEVVARNKVRREEKLRRRTQEQEVPRIRENELEAELMGKALTRKDYLRQRKDLGLGDVNPWTNGDKTGTIRPSNWT